MPIRGSGRTTRQILGAPEFAIYIAPTNQAAEMFRTMARKLNRGDLEFVSIGRVNAEYFKGRDFSVVVIDHACYDFAWGYETLTAIEQAIATPHPGKIKPVKKPSWLSKLFIAYLMLVGLALIWGLLWYK